MIGLNAFIDCLTIKIDHDFFQIESQKNKHSKSHEKKNDANNTHLQCWETHIYKLYTILKVKNYKSFKNRFVKWFKKDYFNIPYPLNMKLQILLILYYFKTNDLISEISEDLIKIKQSIQDNTFYTVYILMLGAFYLKIQNLNKFYEIGSFIEQNIKKYGFNEKIVFTNTFINNLKDLDKIKKQNIIFLTIYYIVLKLLSKNYANQQIQITLIETLKELLSYFNLNHKIIAKYFNEFVYKHERPNISKVKIDSKNNDVLKSQSILNKSFLLFDNKFRQVSNPKEFRINSTKNIHNLLAEDSKTYSRTMRFHDKTIKERLKSTFHKTSDVNQISNNRLPKHRVNNTINENIKTRKIFVSENVKRKANLLLNTKQRGFSTFSSCKLQQGISYFVPSFAKYTVLESTKKEIKEDKALNSIELTNKRERIERNMDRLRYWVRFIMIALKAFPSKKNKLESSINGLKKQNKKLNKCTSFYNLLQNSKKTITNPRNSFATFYNERISNKNFKSYDTNRRYDIAPQMDLNEALLVSEYFKFKESHKIKSYDNNSGFFRLYNVEKLVEKLEKLINTYIISYTIAKISYFGAPRAKRKEFWTRYNKNKNLLTSAVKFLYPKKTKVKKQKYIPNYKALVDSIINKIYVCKFELQMKINCFLIRYSFTICKSVDNMTYEIYYDSFSKIILFKFFLTAKHSSLYYKNFIKFGKELFFLWLINRILFYQDLITHYKNFSITLLYIYHYNISEKLRNKFKTLERKLNFLIALDLKKIANPQLISYLHKIKQKKIKFKQNKMIYFKQDPIHFKNYGYINSKRITLYKTHNKHFKRIFALENLFLLKLAPQEFKVIHKISNQFLIFIITYSRITFQDQNYWAEEEKNYIYMQMHKKTEISAFNNPTKKILLKDMLLNYRKCFHNLRYKINLNFEYPAANLSLFKTNPSKPTSKPKAILLNDTHNKMAYDKFYHTYSNNLKEPTRNYIVHYKIISHKINNSKIFKCSLYM